VLARMGSYEVSVFGNASKTNRSSSINFNCGNAHRFSVKSLDRQFVIKEVLRDLTEQMQTTRISENFVGNVVLSTIAIEDMLR
jgi:hypothetical protein